VTDRPNVHVRLRSIKFFFSHSYLASNTQMMCLAPAFVPVVRLPSETWSR
jgi:hypothetical protein